MVIERFGDQRVFGALEDELGRRLTLDEVIAARDGDRQGAARRGRRVAARARPGPARVPRARRGARPADRLGGVPRADRADPRAGGRRGARGREPRHGRPGRLARDVPRRPALRRLRRALQARAPSPASARSRTSGTASPTAASRSRPSGASPATASPCGSTAGRRVRAVRRPARRALRRSRANRGCRAERGCAERTPATVEGDDRRRLRHSIRDGSRRGRLPPHGKDRFDFRSSIGIVTVSP